jgi:enoyl-CoA hydratase/carnithine racemase
MTCRPFSAAEAISLGFLNRVVETDGAVPGAVMAEAEKLAGNLAGKSSLVLYSSKTSINAALEAMAPAGSGWSDADSLVTALRDPESRERGDEYLQRVRKKA